MIIWFDKQNFYEYWRHVVSLPIRADLCFGVCVGGGGGEGLSAHCAWCLRLPGDQPLSIRGPSSGREIVLYTGLLLL